MWSPKGVAESPEGDSLHAYPARGYFSVKKSNQKSLGEDPETPRVGTPRIIGAPARSQDLVGKGGCTAAGRAARSKAQGQPDLSEGCVRRDDAYKVFILIRFLLGPNKMRRRYLESVSSRSLALGGSWGAAPSVFWYGAPGGSQGPPGKGGAAERWRVVYPIGIDNPIWSKARDDARIQK